MELCGLRPQMFTNRRWHARNSTAHVHAPVPATRHGGKPSPAIYPSRAWSGLASDYRPEGRLATAAADLLGPLVGDALPDAALPIGLGLALPAVGFLAYCFYLYTQMEYITAAMLSRHVPRSGSGASVIQVGGGTKELFYYPKNTLQVTSVGQGVNKSLMEQAGLQAGVPTVARVQPPTDLSFAASSSIDAVVCLRTTGEMTSTAIGEFLQEASRVLKPGCPLVFVENEKSKLLQVLSQRQNQWEKVEYDVALEKLWPHVAGVASRNWRYVAPPAPPPRASSGAGAAVALPTAKDAPVAKPKTKGFS